jgi:hypothetical protein
MRMYEHILRISADEQRPHINCGGSLNYVFSKLANINLRVLITKFPLHRIIKYEKCDLNYVNIKTSVYKKNFVTS